MDSHYDKYIKYKKKYLELKNNNQLGGGFTLHENFINNMVRRILNIRIGNTNDTYDDIENILLNLRFSQRIIIDDIQSKYEVILRRFLMDMVQYEKNFIKLNSNNYYFSTIRAGRNYNLNNVDTRRDYFMVPDELTTIGITNNGQNLEGILSDFNELYGHYFFTMRELDLPSFLVEHGEDKNLYINTINVEGYNHHFSWHGGDMELNTLLGQVHYYGYQRYCLCVVTPRINNNIYNNNQPYFTFIPIQGFRYNVSDVINLVYILILINYLIMHGIISYHV